VKKWKRYFNGARKEKKRKKRKKRKEKKQWLVSGLKLLVIKDDYNRGFESEVAVKGKRNFFFFTFFTFSGNSP